MPLAAGDGNNFLSNDDLKMKLIKILTESKSSVMLPIFEVLESVTESLSTKSNLLLQAAPGAGKTTIVPLQLLLEEADSADQIIVVAPRRVAVRSAAKRMAALLGEPVGKTVGYAMRDDTKVGPNTRIKVVTDGVLLNLMRDDPLLEGVSTVVLDEFHERGVGSDTCLALLREVQENFREFDDMKPLKIVVMSATLLGKTGNNSNSEVEDSSFDSTDSMGSNLTKTLGGASSCGIIESEGRQFPIQIHWARQVVQTMSSSGNKRSGGPNRIPPLGSLLRDRKSLIQTVADVVERAALKQAPDRGDILVFLPGVAECKGVVRELSSRNTVRVAADVFALYGAMSTDEQDRVLFPSKYIGDENRRQRIIVSTPIAEASLTIPGVTCVVDSGLRREPRCDADTGMSRLVSTRISKASAVQRSGRAGRVREGLCLRLYTESEFDQDFMEQSPPEIISTDLAPTLLLLADWGASSMSQILQEMPFLDPPDPYSLEQAARFLVDIGALQNKDGGRFGLTDLGRTISKISCHPRLAACISAAIEKGKDEDSTLLAAAISASFCLDDDSAIGGKRNTHDPNLAYSIELALENSFKFSALLRFAMRVSGTRGKAAIQFMKDNRDDFRRRAIANLGKALLPGFVDLIGERKGEASYDSSNYFLAVGKSSRLGLRQSPPFILAVDTNTGPDGISRIRSYVSLSKELLDDFAIDEELLYTVPSKGYQVRAKQVRSIGRIELYSSPLPSPSSKQISRALLDAMTNDLGGIASSLLKFLTPSEKAKVEQLVARISLDQELTGNMDWPTCFEALDSTSTGSEKWKNDGVESDLKKLVEPWLASVNSLKELRTHDILLSSLTPELQMYLDEYYPTFIGAPDGSRIPVRYIRTNNENETGQHKSNFRPVAAAKVQQFFGAQQTPRVGPSNLIEGKQTVPVTLSLQSPAGKPLAETIDLPFFWKEVYPSIRSEMRGRYPKHPWPEDPFVASATRKTKKEFLNDEDLPDADQKSARKGRQRRRKRK